MLDETAEDAREARDREDEAAARARRAKQKKIERGRTFYDNVGTFRDVFKIVLIVAILLMLAIHVL